MRTILKKIQKKRTAARRSVSKKDGLMWRDDSARRVVLLENPSKDLALAPKDKLRNSEGRKVKKQKEENLHSVVESLRELLGHHHSSQLVVEGRQPAV